MSRRWAVAVRAVEPSFGDERSAREAQLDEHARRAFCLHSALKARRDEHRRSGRRSRRRQDGRRLHAREHDAESGCRRDPPDEGAHAARSRRRAARQLQSAPVPPGRRHASPSCHNSRRGRSVISLPAHFKGKKRPDQIGAAVRASSPAAMPGVSPTSDLSGRSPPRARFASAPTPSSPRSPRRWPCRARRGRTCTGRGCASAPP